ncbi:MAG: NAD(P)H-dependent oxidoreductase subunit E [Myxococcota bacterium]|nr:NAD(P)H-dependent oxidoreductase subunit E [Myxococcota bacterium]
MTTKKYRLSVCKGPDCKGNGSDAVFKAAQEALVEAGLGARCSLGRGGCYGLCHLGANVIVREDTGRPKDPFSREDFQLMGWEGETHYGAMTPQRVRQVIAEHIGGDRVVTPLVADSSDTETDTRLLRTPGQLLPKG